ncbi:MspA family porin [Tsukamurella soli]|uniref:MspA protein n=1 Tax=Tsukamurella soli TaxID=644556 RepID=A0ABP8KEA2_9ACTN
MKKHVIRAASAAAVAGLGLSALAAGPANADTLIRLPGGKTVQRIGAGTITVTLTGESAKLSPGMVALPTTRNAWVSGTVHAKITGKDPGNGTLQAGYVVGCQISVGDANISAGAGGSGPIVSSPPDKGDQVAGVSASTGGSISLSAGTIGAQNLTWDKPTWPGAGDAFKPSSGGGTGWQAPTNNFPFVGDSGSLSYSDETIGVDGCAGYAQARFYTYVTGQVGKAEGTVVLWGKPFTLG